MKMTVMDRWKQYLESEMTKNGTCHPFTSTPTKNSDFEDDDGVPISDKLTDPTDELHQFIKKGDQIYYWQAATKGCAAKQVKIEG
jgi:hypothetical protein